MEKVANTTNIDFGKRGETKRELHSLILFFIFRL